MSLAHLTASSTSNLKLQLVFNNALREYEKQTNINLLVHPLAAQLQSCNSTSAILNLLREQVRDSDGMSTKWLYPMVNVLCAPSMALGERVVLVISPAKVIFTGVGVLLSTAKNFWASRDTLVELEIFERIGEFFRRLEVWTEVVPTMEMMDMIICIMIEVLSILAISTKDIKRGRLEKYWKKLVGTNLEDAVKRLDNLTQDEARMAVAQVLKATHAVDHRVEGVVDKVLEINDKVTTADDRVATERDQIQIAFRGWLSPPDSTIKHNMASNIRKKGGSNWFLQSNTFREWNSKGPLLWIHGKPGSGKSVLCSAIIEDIKVICKVRLAYMAYFYFDFAHKQSHRDMISSVIFQLSTQSNRYHDILYRLYLVHYSGDQTPSDSILTECLKDMLSMPSKVPMYILVDAIDECHNSNGLPAPRENLLGLVKELIDLSLPNLRLCFTSRPEFDIRVFLEPLASFRVSLHNEIGQKQDIADYIKATVYSDGNMRKWSDEDKVLVIKMLTERADGMFQWVFCLLEVLRHCSSSNLRRALYELPETLDETYERILMEIRKCNRDIARRLLQCLTVAIRPLRVEELAAVAAVNFDSLLESVEPIPKFFTDWLSDPECVISICSSLVTITDIDGSSVVKFSHPSVKEFLTSSRLAISKGRVSFYHISLEPAHTTLAQACLSVLKDYLDRGRDSIEKIPLVKYAAKHWDDHARFKNVASHIQEGMELLFDPEKPHFANWVRIYDMDNPFGLLQTHLPAHLTRTNATPLYYAALCGLPSLTEHFIAERPMDVDARGGQYVTAIQAALYKRHLPIVRLLIEHGADVNSRDDAGSSLLHVAAQIGDPEAVRLLIDYAADLAAFDSAGSTPLHLASREGNNLVVALLINRGAKVDARDNNNSTPLHHASAKGNDMAVKLLIENRADSTARDKKETPLLDVSHGDAFDVVRLLLDHGAEINAQNDDGQTPLHIASQVGVANLVQYLLTAGADVNVRDYNGKTPLDASPDNKDNCDAAS